MDINPTTQQQPVARNVPETLAEKIDEAHQMPDAVIKARELQKIEKSKM